MFVCSVCVVYVWCGVCVCVLCGCVGVVCLCVCVVCVCGAHCAHCVKCPAIGEHSIAAGMSGEVVISRDWQGSRFDVIDGETNENHTKPHTAESHM